jgi:mono/diheme cytochrome c family protein
LRVIGDGSFVFIALHQQIWAKNASSLNTVVVGNWNKRAISRPVVKGSQKALLLSEASYRHIIYFNTEGPTAENGQADLSLAGAKRLSSTIVADESNIAKGRSLFNQKCVACHGEDGRSQTEFAAVMPVKPKDLTGTEVRARSEGEIYTIVANGIPSKGMPALKGRISEESLWQIALYIRYLSRNKAPESKKIVASASPSASTAPKVAEKRYLLKGKVISIDRDHHQVTIEHEEIQGYMGAMTMPFPLKDLKTLERLKKDDQIEATLIVDDKSWRLENVLINKK